MQFCWVKGFGLGSALPNSLDYVTGPVGAVSGRRLLKFGLFGRFSAIEHSMQLWFSVASQTPLHEPRAKARP
jgi:hypothetical protein